MKFTLHTFLVRFNNIGGSMAKRFTDTDKWKRPWFQDLPLIAKMAWVWMLDECDHRGVWHISFKRISIDLDTMITRTQFDSWFQDKFIAIDEDKYFIPSFVEFQYGELNATNNAHKPIISLLSQYSIDHKTLCKFSPSRAPHIGAQDKDKEMDMDKEKDKDKEREERIKLVAESKKMLTSKV